jgi:hypothetical protein
MADTKDGRDKQARDEERRQRERALEGALERADEAEPDSDEPAITVADLDEALEAHDYPTTRQELVAALGDVVVETETGWTSMADVFDSLEDDRFDSADEVRYRILRLVDQS